MPIPIQRIVAAAPRATLAKARTLTEARAKGLQTAFLCHSHKDAGLLRGLVTLLVEAGWSIYIDSADASMPETPTRDTAARIKQKIVEVRYFLFLATANSMASRWCPWEIGYADGKKSIDDILIIPTTDMSGRWQGSEYLQLDRRIDDLPQGGLGVFEPGQGLGKSLRLF